MRLADAVVVAVLALSGLAQVWGAPASSLQGGRAVHAVLLAVITLPLLVRRRHAVLVCVTVVGASWLQYELGGGLGQAFFATMLALYAVGAHADYPWTLVGAGATAASVLAVDIPKLAAGDPLDEIVPVWFVLAGVWAFGRWMRRRGTETASLTERAETAEREREERAQQAVAEERARIARELHDLVAHSMGVIVLQSQGAQRTLHTDPQAARVALAAIEATGRNGLAEMRRLLGLLTASDGVDATSPQPGLDRLDDLVDQVRQAGLPVELCVEGDMNTVSPGIELAAYRIVQEALTNTLKHAGPASARVVVRRLGDRLDVEVADDGASSNATTVSGHGLVGMRERVALYGGSLYAGRQADGGYLIRARIPVDNERS